MRGALVIVPCGQGKIWDRDPRCGPTPARDAYTGAPFKVNRHFGERFGERWVILSAKYGFIRPNFVIPGPYNVTFRRRSSNPVAVSVLREQIVEQGLGSFELVIGLGGAEYRAAMRKAFAGMSTMLYFPFAGLPLGKGMHATKRAVETGTLRFLDRPPPRKLSSTHIVHT